MAERVAAAATAGPGTAAAVCFARGAALAFLVLVLAQLPAWAQLESGRGTPREAQAMVARAIALYDAQGLAAFRQITLVPRPGFRAGDLYVVVIDRLGFIAANSLDPRTVGFNALNARDREGTYYVREMMRRATAGGVWVDYIVRDPVLGHPPPKSTWVVRHDNFLFACGIYAGELGV